MEVLRDHAAYIAFHIRYGSWNKKKKMPGSPKQLVKLQPFFFLPLIGLWVNPGAFLFANTWILAWYAATLVLFLAWVWGDSDRYLAYSTVPTAILSAVSLNVGISMLFMIPPLLVSSVMIFRNTQVFYRLEPHPDFTKFDTSEDAVFLVMPSSLTYVSARYLKGRILVGGGNAVAVKFDLETLPNMMRTTPNKLLDDYPITHCLLGPKNLDFIKPVEDRFEFVMKTNGFVLYKRKQSHS